MSTHRTAKRRKHRTLIILIIGLVIVGLIGIFLSKYQTPYYAKTPAPVTSLKSHVTVQGKKDREQGAYLVTAVQDSGPLTVAQLLWAKMQPYSEILTKKAAFGDSDYNDYFSLQQQYQQIVADHAVQTAFKLAGKPVRIQYHGAYVLTARAGSPFEHQLQEGDTIIAVDGKSYATTKQYEDTLAARKVGEQIALTVIRPGRLDSLKASGRVKRVSDGKANIGPRLTDRYFVTTTPLVTVNVPDSGGASGGLMFALQIYAELTGQHLRRGEQIAGTGKIDASGNVYEIGGVDKKVYSAAKAGASVFFVPNQPATKKLLKQYPHYQNNYAEAKRTAKQLGTKMHIVPVKTVKDAVNYLKKR